LCWVEEQINRKLSFRRSSSSNYPTKTIKRKKNSYDKERPQDNERDMAQAKTKYTNHYVALSEEVKNKQVQCFKILEKGHYAFECPQKKTLILKTMTLKCLRLHLFPLRKKNIF